MREHQEFKKKCEDDGEFNCHKVVIIDHDVVWFVATKCYPI